MLERKTKKSIITLVLAVGLLSGALTAFLLGNWYERVSYKRLSRICQILIETAPETEQPLLAALKQYKMQGGQDGDRDFLQFHGYKETDFQADEDGQQPFWLAVLFLTAIGSLCLFVWLFSFRRQKQERIEELTVYLEQVNLKGAGTIIQPKEDEFSLLQDEIYKTVTALYQTRDAALKAKKNYAENLANIAHQLKTPVTAALISLQLLMEKDSGSYTEKIKYQLERLAVLEEALLTLSRLDSGTLKLEHIAVDVYTVLNLAADNLRDLALERNITIEIPEQGCFQITGDMDWTMEAFLNLMKNAMEHTQAGGTIHCEYAQNPLYTEIIIWDEGEGFAKEDLPHIFERFYRGKNAKGKGIGIGLALAKSIIELENGVISAKNLPNAGACFEVRFYSH